MLRFFNRIRYKLAVENKPVKYLRYAIGEIFLVVLGILLALQINNWNEARKIEKEEISILENLLVNLKNAKEQCNIHILEEQTIEHALLVSLGISRDSDVPNLTLIPDSIVYLSIWEVIGDIPVINTYSDLKNIGKVGIIKNRTVRESFTNLEVSLNELSNLVNDRLSVHQVRIDDIPAKKINFVRVLNSKIFNTDTEPQNDYRTLFSDQQTRNLMAIKLDLTNDIIDSRKSLAEEINDLIVDIEIELRNRLK